MDEPPSSAINQVIQLTPAGSAAIAVLRLLGPAVPAFLQKYFSTNPKPYRCTHGLLRDGARLIDDPIVVLGHGFADINLHGGIWVIQQVTELAQREGFQIANWDQAPESETELEQEVERSLPLARTELATRILLAQPQAWQSHPEITQEIISDRALWWLLHPPRVAIVGPANAGKSTLANQLFAAQRSIVADIPGTTRDWVGELADINGLPIMLVDTPGWRLTSDPIERAAIETSRGVINDSDLVIIVLDAAQPLSPQMEIRAKFPTALIVLNKFDLIIPEMRSIPAIPTIATTAHGVDQLKIEICRRFSCHQMDFSKPRWWLPRHHEILKKGGPLWT